MKRWRSKNNIEHLSFIAVSKLFNELFIKYLSNITLHYKQNRNITMFEHLLIVQQLRFENKQYFSVFQTYVIKKYQIIYANKVIF